MNILTARQVAAWSAGLTVVIEVITAVMRFGLKMQSTRDTASTVGALTRGIRIHHGYIGLLAIIVAACLLKAAPALSRWVLVGGIALVASDLIHHFVVLWLVVGDPEFHLVYPAG
ncbi:hypothetical protein ACFLQU_04680 [Verrucomicrobiota bacterium]